MTQNSPNMGETMTVCPVAIINLRLYFSEKLATVVGFFNTRLS
jgi:hypothetical protein